METTKSISTFQFFTKEQLLAHWQGHRALSRRVLEAFPEKELFEFSIGGMRTYAQLAKEMISMAAPTAKGLATDTWEEHNEELTELKTKEDLLANWDDSTKIINEYWDQIPEDRFQQTVVAFGQYEDKGYCTLLYIIENEVHHRGQGFVYLRALGITPPNFWERD